MFNNQQWSRGGFGASYNSTGLPGFGAPKGTNVKAAGEKLSSNELLSLNLTQIVDPDFVFKQTRGNKVNSKLKFNTNESKNEEPVESKDLVATVLKESRIEHLTTGLVDEEELDLGKDHEAKRLSRELAAQAFSSDTFQNLLNRRSHILRNLVAAFSAKDKQMRTSVLKQRVLASNPAHSLVRTAVEAGIASLINVLQDSALNNQVLCLSILSSLKEQLKPIGVKEFAHSKTIPAPEITHEAVRKIHVALTEIANNPKTSQLVREQCLELLVGLGVVRYQLQLFLSSVKTLLFPVKRISHLNILPSLYKLGHSSADVYIDQPLSGNHETRINVTEISQSQYISVATDGAFLYTHSRAGFLKIGTGKNATTPGTVVKRVAKFKSYEKSKIAIVDRKIYYRSANIGPNALMVYDTKTLEEIGTIKADGSGTYKTANNTHWKFDVPSLKKKKKLILTPRANDFSTPTTFSDEKQGGDMKQDDIASKKKMNEQKDKKDPTKDKKDQFAKGKQDPLAKGKKDQHDEKKDGPSDQNNNNTQQGQNTQVQQNTQQARQGQNNNNQQGQNNNNQQGQNNSGPMLNIPNQADIDPSSVPVTPSGDDEKDKKKKKVQVVGPVFSDGRFLMVGELKQAKGAKMKGKGNLDLHILDPRSSPALKEVHSCTLTYGEPKGNCALKFEKKKSAATPFGSFGNQYGSVNVGAPEHLKFAGAITMECWFKIPTAYLSDSYYGLFSHGDASYRTYLYAQRTGICCGTYSRMASGSCYVGCSIIPDTWTHIAATYDPNGKQWMIYLNGEKIGFQAGSCGSQVFAQDWIIGSSASYTFRGDMAEARIWKKHRTGEEIKAGMKSRVDVSDPDLVGYWPLDDGMGLSVRDLSQYKQRGTIKNCQWDEDTLPPFEDQEKREEKSDKKEYFIFPESIVDQLVTYTNGECMAILYPQDIAQKMFAGAESAVFQVFSTQTGKLLDEQSHSFTQLAKSACVTPDQCTLFVHQDTNGTGVIHQYIASPPSGKSPWRAKILKRDLKNAKIEEKDVFPTTRMISDMFPLPPRGEKLNEEFDEDSKVEYDQDSIDTHTALIYILSKLESDCQNVNRVNTANIPGSLQYLLSVDLSAETFESLLELTEGLAKDYFGYSKLDYTPNAPNKKLDQASADKELRMYAFLVCLKLLRINIMHLVGWNADPKQCGFVKKAETSDEKKKEEDKKVLEKRKRNRKVIKKKVGKDNLTLQEKFVKILNRLILEAPSGGVSKLIATKVSSEVSRTLSVGMQIFYGDPASRVAVLSDLVNEALKLGDKVNPLRMSLMNEYFDSQGNAENLMTILPYLSKISLKEDKTEKEIASCKLIPQTIDYLIVSTKDFLRKVVASKGEGNEEKAFTKSKANIAKFLGKCFIALRGRLTEAMSKAAMGSTQDEKEVDFVIQQIIAMINKSTNLIEFALKLADQAKKNTVVTEKMSRLLNAGFGTILLPLYSSMWDLSPSIKHAARFQYESNKLLVQLDKFGSLLSSVKEAETSYLKGVIERQMISRTSVCETPHPVRQGRQEKFIALQGVSEITITFDPRTFKNWSQGTSLQLFYKSGMQEPVPNGSFTGIPKKPVVVKGGKVFVTMNSGYQGNWGFKATAKAFIEEDKIQLPWVLDVSRAAALVTGKCAGVLLRGQKVAETEQKNTKWLEADFLGQGIQYSDKESADEKREFESFKTGLVKQNAIRPMLMRQQSYEGVSLPDLVAKLVKKLKADRVNAGMKYPYPKQVTEKVENCIQAFLIYLVKHNKMVSFVTKYVGGTEPATANIGRIWKQANKLTQWLLQKYQVKRSESLKTEDEKKKEEEKKGSEVETKIKTKAEIYSEICDSALERLEFLGLVVPVPKKAVLNKKPSFQRQKSVDDSEKERSALTDEEKKARATFLAWQAQGKKVALKDASDDERFSILYKSGIDFLNSDVNITELKEAMKERRKRTRIRCYGFQSMTELLSSVGLSSVKREIIASLIPSLSWSDSESASGVAPDVESRLRPIGEKLHQELQTSFKVLYKYLITLLQDTETSGSYLLQAVLQAFSLQYTEENFEMIIELGIFKALRKILLDDSSEEKQLEEKTENKEDDSENSKLAYQTSSWALLDLLTSVMSKQRIKRGEASSGSGSKQPVFEILLRQLAKTAVNQRTRFSDKSDVGGFVADLPEGESHGVKQEEDEDVVNKKVGTTMAFGMKTSSADLKELGDLTVDSASSFTIRVLNLIDNICNINEGLTKVKGKVGLESLLSLIRYGAPRTQLVATRIMRKLFSSKLSPSPEEMAEVLKTSGIKATSFTSFLLEEVGRKQTTSIFTALTTNGEAMKNRDLKDMLESLRLYKGYTQEGVHAEASQIMLLRTLAKTKQWKKAVSEEVGKGLLSAQTVLESFKEYESKSEVDTPLTGVQFWNKFWVLIGSLNVYGGYVDGLRVGTKVYLPSKDSKGRVVLRNFETEKVSVVQDGEVTVDVFDASEVVSIGDTPFCRSDFKVSASKVLSSLKTVWETESEAVKEKKAERKKLIKSQKEEVSKGLVIPVNMINIAKSAITSRVLRLCHSLFLEKSFVDELANSKDFDFKSTLNAIVKIGKTETPLRDKGRVSTSSLEERLNVLLLECCKRARSPLDISVTLSHETPRLRFSKPAVAFEAEFTRLGESIELGKELKGNVSYIRLGEKVTKELCESKVVMLDTYEVGSKLEDRVKLAEQYGAIAIILSLHSGKAKLEGLHIEEDEEEKKSDAVDSVRAARNLAAANLVGGPPRRGGFRRGFGRGGFGMQGGMRVARAQPTTKKEETDTDKEQTKREAATNLPCIAISDEVSKTVRRVLGVKASEDPSSIHTRSLGAKLIAKGYSEEHASIALEKGDFDVEKALQWLEDNADWLEGTGVVDVQDAGVEEPETEDRVFDDVVQMIEKWKIFLKEAPDHETFKRFSKLRAAISGISGQYFSALASRTSDSILLELLQVEKFVSIQYARRALVSVFMNHPAYFADQDELLAETLHIGLSLNNYPSCELNPVSHVSDAKNLRFKKRLLDLLLKGDESIKKVFYEDSTRLLKKSLKEEKAADAKTTNVPAQVMGMRGGNISKELHLEDFNAMRIHLEADQTLQRNNWAVTMKIYEDATCTQLIKTCTIYGSRTDEVLIPGNKCYYECVSANWYQGCQAMNVNMRITDIPNLLATDKVALRGSVSTVNTYVDLLLRSGVAVPNEITLLMLRSLAYGGDASLVRDSARTIIRLFNTVKGKKNSFEGVLKYTNDAEEKFDNLAKEDEEKKEEVVKDKEAADVKKEDKKKLSEDEKILEGIATYVAGLEFVHSGLRTNLLCNWEDGTIPGPHMQSLLELVLAIKLAAGGNPDEDFVAAEGVTESELHHYKNSRDGQQNVQLVNIINKRVQKQHTITAGNTQCRDVFVGDVCVRSGKWYWEIKMNANPGYINMGWINRKYRKLNHYENLGNDRDGNSWSFSGPNVSYIHRGSQHQPVQKAGKAVVVSQMQANTVVGFMVDCDAREMQMTLNGVSTGVVFQGFDPQEGIYPTVSPGYNVNVEVNFGKKPFAHNPNTPAAKAKKMKKKEDIIEGFLPLEDARFSGSSWLPKYRHATEVAKKIYSKTPLSEDTLKKVLKDEVSLKPTDMKFEVAQTSAAFASSASVPDNCLVDDASYYTPNEKDNFHMTFCTQGKDTDVILQKLSVRCYRSQGQIEGLVFVSEKLPDLDSFTWCDGFTKQNYEQFVARKRKLRQPWRSHEPVAYFGDGTHFATTTLDTPKRGKYITIKITARTNLWIEYVKFTCIHGAHPLGALLGSPLLEQKTKEFADDLLKHTKSVNGNKDWTFEMDAELVNMAQALCDKLGITPRDLDAVMFKPGPDEIMQFKKLEKITMDQLKARFAILKYLNKIVAPLLHYVDIRVYKKEKSKVVEEEKKAPTKVVSGGMKFSFAKKPKKVQVDTAKLLESDDKESLAYITHELKGLYFMSTKRSLLDALLQIGTPPPGARPNQAKISINRIKASRAKENPSKDPDGLKSIFGQVFSQLRESCKAMTRARKGQQLFQVTFLGEGSIDAGGPYRECMTQIAGDLMSTASPLFIQCPNGKNGVGLGREKYIINPEATGTKFLEQYEFVGVLMGIALRTGHTMNFDLPKMIWKQLLGDETDKSDLEAIDKLCIQALNEIGKFTKDKFGEYVSTWVTRQSDGKEIDLIDGGSDKKVAFEDAAKFVKLSIESRLKEGEHQVRAMKKGLNSVVGEDMLALFSAYDLEFLVCGNPEINLDRLRKHAVYQGVKASDQLIKNLWKVLESFDTRERQMFLRFVWGRSRLPISDSDWRQKFTVHILKNCGDDKLPISHTCFFSFEMPYYSTYEIMRKKILFAIVNCQAIDIDFNPNNSQLSAFVDSD